MELTRRRFLQLSGAGAGVAAINLSAFPAMANSFNSANGEYKAIVGIGLGGGSDGYNMIIPSESEANEHYRNVRGYLALEPSQCIAMDTAVNPAGLMMHPSLEALKPYWDNGHLAAMLNVGTLVQRITNAQYNNDTRPTTLFSHSHQSTMMQSHSTKNLSKEGFGALADTLIGNTDVASATYDMSGLRVWTNCLQSPSNSVGSSVPKEIFNYEHSRELFNKLNDPSRYQNIFEKHYAELASDAPIRYQAFAEILNNSEIDAKFPSTGLGQQLAAVLKMLLNREQFNQPAQYFSCGLGGWDTHSNQLPTQEAKFLELAEAMAAFQAALIEYGLERNVTTFTYSDFGRSLIPNGSGGTDHGWASHSFVMGGAVAGGKFYGEYPDISDASPYRISRGRMIPTLSTDQVHASLLSWLGVKDAGIHLLFPTLAPNSGSGISPATLPLFDQGIVEVSFVTDQHQGREYEVGRLIKKIEVEAISKQTDIKQVEYFVNGQSVRVENHVPYRMYNHVVTAGQNVIEAVATDINGNKSSATMSFVGY